MLQNTAIGSFALRDNNLGQGNVALGTRALRTNTEGNENVALGVNALRDNILGNRNVAIGFSVLEENINASDNLAIGYEALKKNTSGDANISIGSFSMDSNTSGNENTAIGTSALGANTSGSLNTAIGRSSLLGNLTGSNLTALGYNSKTTLPNLQNATAIGARAEVATSNAMVLGSIDGVNGATASVNVGIGTTSPDARLDVVGSFQLQDGNESDGYVLATDASGNATWVDPATVDGKWISNGADIERQSGDVYIGDDATTNNDLYLSDQLIDWDDSNYYIDPDGQNRVRQMSFDNGGTILASIRFDDANTGFISPASRELGYIIDGNHRFRIDAAGWLGLRGITDPDYNVHLKQSSNTEGGAGGIGLESSSSMNQWKVYHSGSHFSFAENGTRRAYIEATSGDYIQPSDERLKRNFEVVSQWLPKVKDLTIYRYEYKNQKGNKKSLGVKAQEVQTLFPELISEGEDGYLGMNYAGLSVVAIEAIKEQQQEMEQLKENNSRLQEQLAQVLARLEVLEQKR